ncbi:MAG: D-amino-acid transaminase [Pseudomonadota bacterium]
MTRIAYVNGEYLPLEWAKISVLDRGFLFADGVYEVTAVLDGKLADYPGHVRRLHRSLGELGMALPCSDDELLEIHRELTVRNTLTEGAIYLQVTRGAADRDFTFPDDASPSLVLFTQKRALKEPEIAKTGYKVKTVPDIRWARRDIKSVALLAQVLAKQTAKEAGCQEAWMIQDGHITEGGSSTAFIITKAGEIVTRPLSNDILPGITRQSIMSLAQEHNLTVSERLFTRDEALDAAEAFVTAATALVMPCVEIDGQPIGDGKPGPHVTRLRQLYIDNAIATGI